MNLQAISHITAPLKKKKSFVFKAFAESLQDNDDVYVDEFNAGCGGGGGGKGGRRNSGFGADDGLEDFSQVKKPCV